VKLNDALENYYYYTGKTSEIVRQLGFAGIAIVWIFRTDVGGRPTVPPELLPAALFIVMGLTLDLLQYVGGSVIWGIYHRKKEVEGTGAEAEFLAPPQINWLTLFLFWSKTVVMVIAYVLVLRFLYSRLF